MDAAGWRREYDRCLGSRQILEDDCNPALLEYHIPFLRRLDSIDGSSIALYDMRTRSYCFLTESFKFLAGCDRDAAISGGPDYFFGVMHPGHLPFVLETVTRTMIFLYGLLSAERKDYRLSFDFSIRQADGASVRLVQQIVVLELDRRGNIWLVLVANDRAPKGQVNAPPDRRLLNMKTGAFHLFLPREHETGTEELSRREIEVLGLVAAGMASREIADRLCISINTVNNHRQRILEKLGTKSSAEAVHYAVALGLV